MGCKQSKIIEHAGELYNQDSVFTRRILTGVTASKDAEGISGNVQLAVSSTRRKKYTRVTGLLKPIEEEKVEEMEEE